MKWDAERYEMTHVPRADAGLELMEMAKIKDSDSILDIGCGTGNLTLELGRKASRGRVVGIDPSAEMLAMAGKRAEGTENMVFLKMAAQELDFASEFDLVYSNSSLQWIHEQAGVIGLAYKALRPGGRIVVQLPAKDFCWPVMENINSAISALGLEPKFREMLPPWLFPLKVELQAYLETAGFKEVQVFYRDYTLIFESVNEVLDWGLAALLRPYLIRLSQNMQERFKYAFAMGFENYRTDNGIEFSFKRLFASAGKT